MSLNVRILTTGLEKIAKEKYFEDDSEVPVKIAALRKLLKEQPNLKTPLGLNNYFIIQIFYNHFLYDFFYYR